MDDSNDNNLSNLFVSNESENLNKDELLVTMKIDLSKEKNNIIIPDSISIDKLISIPQKKYLEELSEYKNTELQKFKEEIEKNNEKKLESMFKNIINTYNINLFNEDNNNNIQINEINNDNNDNDDNPYFMDYKMISKKKIIPFENKIKNIFSEETSSDNKELLKNINDVKVKSTNIINKSKGLKFNNYFDCIYIINLPNERFKINDMIQIFEEDNIKFKVIDGVTIENDVKYSKYLQRWEFQKNLNYKDLNKYLFDDKIYLRKNTDLKKLKNKIQCWNHWMNEGKYDHRPLYEKTKIDLTSQIGNLIAHMNVIKDAKESNYSRILILEDDVYIHNKYNDIHDNFVKNVDKYDILYYGGIQKKWDNLIFKDGYYNSLNTYGSFAYSITDKLYDNILNEITELHLPMDKILINISKNLSNSFVIYPNIFITDLENGKIHRKRDFKKYSKHFKWKIENYRIPKIE